jgi:hypothetical protein
MADIHIRVQFQASSVLWRRSILPIAADDGSALFFSTGAPDVLDGRGPGDSPRARSDDEPVLMLANMDSKIHVVQSAAPSGRQGWGRAGSGTLSVEVPTNTQILQIGYPTLIPRRRRRRTGPPNAYPTYQPAAVARMRRLTGDPDTDQRAGSDSRRPGGPGGCPAGPPTRPWRQPGRSARASSRA